MSIQPTERTRRRAQRATEPDLVDRLIAAVVERAPELAPQVAELEAAVREQFAGDRGWVRKRNASRPDLARQVLQHFNGRNVTETARVLNISRATVYRMLRVPGADVVQGAAAPGCLTLAGNETPAPLACPDGSDSD
jgi:DNA-binding NtrC family response regulator